MVRCCMNKSLYLKTKCIQNNKLGKYPTNHLPTIGRWDKTYLMKNREFIYLYIYENTKTN